MIKDVSPDAKLYLPCAFVFSINFDITSVVLELSLYLYWPIGKIQNILHTIDYDSNATCNYQN